MILAISTVAITAIVVGLLVVCLGIIVFAGAVDEVLRRRMVAAKKAARR